MSGLFIEWFFITAPKTYLQYLKEVTIVFYNYFSISYLFNTLFAPWRHDAIAMSQVPIRYWFQVIINNGVSRFIGFLLRFFVILGGLLVILVFTTGTILFFIGWYILPIILTYSLYYGLQLLVLGQGV